ncbi:ABC-2 type transport system permease protein [Nonomuraea solani]|uniref:ABC-2 type transport system permease protein n=1 Tax=Nonomuraea solani TaxID=1144553 RepID=A0A1H6EGW1_9ACTN|nr:ABC transporter permease [Nonomuraea solani]SEG97067.1 ABC-2 type transport system permease protein [Nonomuraea solani]
MVWQAVAAEWGKLWSVRSTWWCLACALALTVLTAVTLGGSMATSLVREGITGVTVTASEPVVSATSFVQFALVALAMLTITSEYASGGIRVTLQATPVRGVVLAAKALVVAPVMFAAGVLSGAVATAAVYAVLSAEVFGGLVGLPVGEVTLDLLGVGVFFGLVSVLTVGAGAAMRSAAGTLTVVFMLLMGLPLMLLMTGSQVAVDASMRMPMFAGLAFMGSTDNMTGGPIPYSAGEGLAWLLAWTALAVAAGHAVLRRRDA